MGMYVYVRTRFTALHRWKDAPATVGFLREPHRHVFHVKLMVPVTHSDRDVEFLTLKQEVGEYIAECLRVYNTLDWSCEQWCQQLQERFHACRVEVSEDGENGAIYVSPEMILLEQNMVEAIRSVIQKEQQIGGMLYEFQGNRRLV